MAGQQNQSGDPSSIGSELENSDESPKHLATPLLQVRRRLTTIGLEASADTFLTTSYLAEAAIKLLTLALRAGLEEAAPTAAYRIGYALVRAESLGAWAKVIRQVTTQPLAGLVPLDLRPLVAWLTSKRKGESWFASASDGVDAVFKALGENPAMRSKEYTIAGLIVALVQIRNKTKGHGALGPDFFHAANLPYATAVSALVDRCPAFHFAWFGAFHRAGTPTNVVSLNGFEPSAIGEPESQRFASLADGVHFTSGHSQRVYSFGTLLRTNRDYSFFRLPNGGYRDGGAADFIDYFFGQETREEINAFSAPPAPLPPSETHGLPNLEVQSNVFGNLPAIPRGYVERLALQTEIDVRLRDKNHAIVTLHGRGGVGKTSLALFLAHKLAAEPAPHFEQIVWFSARDIDLTPSGPRPVRAAVVTLEDVSEMYAALFGTEPTEEAFAEVLQRPTLGTRGTLFVFDNFETMANTTDLHRYLDTHTHLPNKVLITSRERAYKADFPVEITGMEFEEAQTMLRAGARELSIQALLTDEVIQKIYDYTDGHAYLMRVILGDIAKQRRYVPEKRWASKRIDVVNAVFERSFNQLSNDARRVFLVIANWNSAVSELALIVVLGRQDIAVERALDELSRLSLVSEDSLADGQPCYFAPQLARVFGQMKLVGDPDRPVIVEDLSAVRSFGVIDIARPGQHDQVSQIERFVAWTRALSSGADAAELRRLDEMLVLVANLWPRGWLEVAEFRRKNAPTEERTEGVAYALRRAVEEMPFSKAAWQQRARFADSVRDSATFVTSQIGAVEADPSDLNQLREAARALIVYIRDHDVPPTLRGSYITSVRGHMERVSSQLDADDLSKLAWLFLVDGDREKAQRFAQEGLEKEAHNQYCKNILDRLAREKGRLIPGRRF